MRFFLDDLKQVRAIEEEQEFLIEENWRELSKNELNELLNPPKTEEQILYERIAEAKSYLQSTDWVEPYLIKHYTGIELLSEDSNKFAIEIKRKEARSVINELT